MAAGTAALPGMRIPGSPEVSRTKKKESKSQSFCARQPGKSRRLGVYGGALQYLAEEVKKPLKYLPE